MGDIRHDIFHLDRPRRRPPRMARGVVLVVLPTMRTSKAEWSSSAAAMIAACLQAGDDGSDEDYLGVEDVHSVLRRVCVYP